MGLFTKNSNSNDTQQATVISAGTLIKGEINCKSILYIDGGFEGSVNCSEMVVIGKSGRVKGLIIANKVIVNGFMHGNIDAEAIDVLRGAVLIGDIVTNELTLENGSKFSGQSMFKSTIDIGAFEDKDGAGQLEGAKRSRLEDKSGQKNAKPQEKRADEKKDIDSALNALSSDNKNKN